MKGLGLMSAVILSLATPVFLAPTPAAAQLYGDLGKDATVGDLNSQDYWWAKFDAMMLELALKQHQPEGRIGLQLASSLRRLDDLAKKYPKHQEIRKWKTRAEEVQAKIDPNADRNKPFGPECPWEEANFAQIWVNVQYAHAAFDDKDYELALSLLDNVQRNYAIMLKPDRMKDYPADLRSWVVDHKTDADKLLKQVNDKLHPDQSGITPVASVTGGELNSQDYWWARFDAMMLELAIKQRQPEGAIAVQNGSSLRRLGDLAKKYPNHEEIKKMKARAEEIDSKIDPNADRRKSLGPECPWGESNFAQLWVNLHWAQSAVAEKDYKTALSCLQNVRQNYDIMLRPDRMKEYPGDLRSWVVDNKPVADKLYQDVKARTGGRGGR
jgi:hypothetical protein